MVQAISDKLNVGIFSFFSGAGFLDLGFETTDGFNILYVNECHKPFLDIYKASREYMKISPPQYGYHQCDITSILTEEGLFNLASRVDESKKAYNTIGFIGGPPCPDFSVGGKNKGKDGENGKLSETYINLICSIKPDFFVFENVKGLYKTTKHKVFFNEMKAKLASSGYKLTEKLINALEYGVPQDRERIILIGFLKHDVNDFDWTQGSLFTQTQIKQIKWPATEDFSIDSELPLPNNIIPELTVEYWFNKNDVNSHPNAIHHFQPRGGLPKFLSIQEGDDSKKSYKRLHRWRYSPTAAYGNNEVHLHPYKARRISAAEALAIQSLPSNFVIPDQITLSNMFKTIGNGVPYLASKGIAQALKCFIEKI